MRPGLETIHVPFLTTEIPRRNDGGLLSLQSAPPVQGHGETQYSFRLGHDVRDHDVGLQSEVIRIDERRFVRDMRIVRSAYQPVYVGSPTGTPEPIRIEHASSCSEPVTASWRDGRAPLIHYGTPPSEQDLSSYYGHAPE